MAEEAEKDSCVGRTTMKCPLCKNQPSMPFGPRLLQPGAGSELLCLDGGGVRGIISLLVLQSIEDRCFNIPITDLMDLAIGTSIGGIAVLALGACEKPDSVKNLISSVETQMPAIFPEKSFAKRILTYASGFIWQWDGYWHSPAEIVRNMFAPENPQHRMRDIPDLGGFLSMWPQSVYIMRRGTSKSPLTSECNLGSNC